MQHTAGAMCVLPPAQGQASMQGCITPAAGRVLPFASGGGTKVRQAAVAPLRHRRPASTRRKHVIAVHVASQDSPSASSSHSLPGQSCGEAPGRRRRSRRDSAAHGLPQRAVCMNALAGQTFNLLLRHAWVLRSPKLARGAAARPNGRTPARLSRADGASHSRDCCRDAAGRAALSKL